MEIYFTKHAEGRLKGRKITKEEVIESIKYPDRITRKRGKYYFQKSFAYGRIEVVCEKKNNIKIITTYWL